jgi:hypothetical protein
MRSNRTKSINYIKLFATFCLAFFAVHHIHSWMEPEENENAELVAFTERFQADIDSQLKSIGSFESLISINIKALKNIEALLARGKWNSKKDTIIGNLKKLQSKEFKYKRSWVVELGEEKNYFIQYPDGVLLELLPFIETVKKEHYNKVHTALVDELLLKYLAEVHKSGDLSTQYYSNRTFADAIQVALLHTEQQQRKVLSDMTWLKKHTEILSKYKTELTNTEK